MDNGFISGHSLIERVEIMDFIHTHIHTQVKYLYFIAIFVKINYNEIIITYFYVTALINSSLSLVNKCNVD
jgi:hypothetical protein